MSTSVQMSDGRREGRPSSTRRKSASEWQEELEPRRRRRKWPRSKPVLGYTASCPSTTSCTGPPTGPCLSPSSALPAADTHTHPFNCSVSGTTRVSRYQKGKTNLDFTEARDSEWQWHQLGRMQICTSLQTDNHARTPPISFLQAGCPSCRPTNSVKALQQY